MTETDISLWKAYCEVGDYFSRLGGSGRYAGFDEYHIPALVLIMALEKVGHSTEMRNATRCLLPQNLWQQTNNLPERVKAIIEDSDFSEQSQLLGFVEYVSSVYKKKAPVEADRWELFIKELKELGWHI